jgi:pSer/pThr/pTyr-binding forkhead associated (FHA) protein
VGFRLDFDRSVSRRHAIFLPSEHTLTVIDRCSRYGTFVNAARLEPLAPHPLAAGDVIRLGCYLFTIVRGDESARPSRKAIVARNGTPTHPDLLRFERGPLAGTDLSLDEGPVTIGGDAWSTVRLRGAYYEGTRIVIFPLGGGVFGARDLGDVPRLFVNGEPISSTRLEHNDLVEVGDLVALRLIEHRLSRSFRFYGHQTR